jgi:hypothetical protein
VSRVASRYTMARSPHLNTKRARSRGLEIGLYSLKTC